MKKRSDKDCSLVWNMKICSQLWQLPCNVRDRVLCKCPTGNIGSCRESTFGFCRPRSDWGPLERSGLNSHGGWSGCEPQWFDQTPEKKKKKIILFEKRIHFIT